MNILIGTASSQYPSNLIRQVQQVTNRSKITLCSSQEELMKYTQQICPHLMLLDKNLIFQGTDKLLMDLRETCSPLWIICLQHQYDTNSEFPMPTHLADYVLHIQNQFDLLIKLIESIYRSHQQPSSLLQTNCSSQTSYFSANNRDGSSG